MPTPMGHALGGLAAALVVDSAWRPQHLTPALLIAAAAVAVAPDLDLLIGSHRTYTHSIGGVAAVGFAAAVLYRGRAASPARAAAILMAAHASHLLLDWMGKDTSTPPGLTIAWPFSSEFYVSGWSVFGEVSRRYWRPQEFIVGNIAALGWELALLTPLLVLVWALWSRRTLRTQRMPNG